MQWLIEVRIQVWQGKCPYPAPPSSLGDHNSAPGEVVVLRYAGVKRTRSLDPVLEMPLWAAPSRRIKQRSESDLWWWVSRAWCSIWPLWHPWPIRGAAMTVDHGIRIFAHNPAQQRLDIAIFLKRRSVMNNITREIFNYYNLHWTIVKTIITTIWQQQYQW